MLSLIVCSYNRDKYLYGALQCIAENDFPTENFEIVLVNNLSTDNTEAECQRFANDYPKVDFRYFIETRQGLSFARNRGIEESRGDVLVFLDDDSYIQENYLHNLQQQLSSHPDADAFGGKIAPVFESGEAPKWLSKWNYSWVSAIDMGDKVRRFEGKAFPIGANMGIRRSTLDKTGAFNTQLGRSKKNLMGGEEKDLFERIQRQGGAIYYFPDVLVHHVIPPSRTTSDYVRRLGKGVGQSERIRTLSVSKWKYLKRLLSELVKWGGTIVLWLGYALTGQMAKGNILVSFRRMVTSGLLKA
ncbi:MAG: glycosyltransferase family 2 protein [Bacteroidales bacterium]|nr:glycosyltransferase family 2 protein [Bacteroidales bacterium]